MDMQQISPDHHHNKITRIQVYTVLSMISYGLCLALPALFFKKSMSGGEILIWGWIVILAGQIAWIANLTYGLGLLLLLCKKWPSALASCCFTILIAIPAFFFTRLPDTGGGSSSLTGYGWVFICWWLAFFFLLAACIASFIDENWKDKNTIGKKISRMVEYSVLALTISIGVYAIHAYLDFREKNLNPALRGTVVSLIPECNATVPAITQPIENFSGTVQFIEINPDGHYADTESSMYFVEKLFRAGATAVQFNDKEFHQYRFKDNSVKLGFTSLKTPADVLVTREIRTSRESQSTRITIIESTSGRTVFDNLWITKESRVPNGTLHPSRTLRSTCPDWQGYSRSGTPLYYPQESLNEAFGKYNAGQSNQQTTMSRNTGIQNLAQNYSSSIQTVTEPAPPSALPETNLISGPGCPADVGWLSEKERRILRVQVGSSNSFFTAKGITLINALFPEHFFCDESSIYFYSNWLSAKNHWIYITKRRLSDLEIEWDKHIRYSFPEEKDPSVKPDLILDSLQEDSNGLHFYATDQNTGWRFQVSTSDEQEISR